MSPRHSALVVLALVCGLGAREARADASVSCDFVEIGASNGEPSMDSGLPAKVQKKLKKAPFSTQWKTFKLLSQTAKVLAKKKSESFALSQGSATATLNDIVGKSKVQLTVTMERDKKVAVKQTSIVEAADFIILTVVLPSDDGHLLAVTCK